jgi:hypothetical protein
MRKCPELIELNNIRRSDTWCWGSKASMLGELLALGFPVPDGFCLSIPTYRQARHKEMMDIIDISSYHAFPHLEAICYRQKFIRNMVSMVWQVIKPRYLA